jgi:hypothetical protein
MAHEKIKEMIQLALLGELSDEEMKQLHDHLIECADCQAEYDRLNDYYSLINENKFPEPDEQMLKEARSGFRNSLNYELSRQTIAEKISNSLRKFMWLHKGPVFAGAVSLCIGFLAGFMIFGLQSSNFNEIFGNGSKTTVMNVQFSDKKSDKGELVFTFDAVKRIKMKGYPSDPVIQKILAEALINEKNPGARIETANTLAEMVKNKPDPGVKAALITALKTDQNPRVRMEALTALLNYPYDNSVKEGLLYVLQHDNNSGMRIAAINELTVAAHKEKGIDPQTMKVLDQKVKNDENQYVRIRAASLIKEGQIQ